MITDYKLTVIHKSGGRLPKPLESYPNGIGGSTQYAVCPVIDGRYVDPPVFTTVDQAEAHRVVEQYRREREA